MVQSIMQRRSSPFFQRAWLTDPWVYVAKSLEQRVYDKGFAYGSLLEESDRTAIENYDVPRSILLLQKLIRLDHDLRNLDLELSDYKSRSPSRSLRMIDVTLCGLQTGTIALMWPLVSRFNHHMPPDLTDTQPTLNSILDEAQFDSSVQRGRHLSDRVLDSAHACLDDSVGSCAAVKCILPLELMRWSSIARHDMAEAETDRRQMLSQLQRIKGMQFVNGLDSDISMIPWIIVEAVPLEDEEARL